MSGEKPVLAVIPARGGSKGLSKKNIRPLVGMPLIAHTIRLADLLKDFVRPIVSTDSEEIAAVARSYGADVPFLRPAELARDDTAMWPVLRHALFEMEQAQNVNYEALLLLDPTCVGCRQEIIRNAYELLKSTDQADGVIGVCQPEINPLWNSWKVDDGWLEVLFEGSSRYKCRQEVPEVFQINAALYLWDAGYVRRTEGTTWRGGRMLPLELSASASIHIDNLEEFNRAEALIKSGYFKLPWLPDERGES